MFEQTEKKTIVPSSQARREADSAAARRSEQFLNELATALILLAEDLAKFEPLGTMKNKDDP